jgi:predicted alpha/beta-hydrolase family hydrolase
MDSPWMQSMAKALGGLGLRVIRFEFPYMATRRADGRRRPPDREAVLLACWRAVLDAHGPAGEVVIGGKSMGGRMASMIADEVGARGLVCLGYPFHPPGKPERLRTAHLETLRTPTLICQGTRDSLGSRQTVVGLALSDSITLTWLEDGDHGFKPRKASGLTEAGHLETAARTVAAFVTRLGAAA